MKSNLLIFTLIILGFCACARYGAPSGGPVDKIPPGIDWELSSPNYKTNFDDDHIEIVFDEWINLNNPVKEIVISPPLAKPPSFTQRGRSVKIEFAEDEILKEDATYQINFGNSVRDFTAGNVLENFIYVFSTGDKIDELSVEGVVIDELSGDPAKDVLVVLYQDLSDTVLYTKKPFYFSKTDDSGKFQLNNIKEDTFQIYALKDANVSYTYDLPGEQIAFYDDFIVVKDSIKEIELKLFDELETPRLVESGQSTNGLIRVKYDRMPQSYQVTSNLPEAILSVEEESDSIYIWHNSTQKDSAQFYITRGSVIDTLSFRFGKKKLQDTKLKLASVRGRLINFHPEDTLKLKFNKILASADTAQIQLVDTSLNQIPMTIHLTDRILGVTSEFKSNEKYNIQLLPGALKDYYGVSNEDTITIDAVVNDPKAFGKIMVNVIGVDSLTYIVELREKENFLQKTKVSSDTIVLFDKLLPAIYNINVIEDRNEDGIWTPGYLKTRRKSEQIKNLTLDELIAGWELKPDLDIKILFGEIED